MQGDDSTTTRQVHYNQRLLKSWGRSANSLYTCSDCASLGKACRDLPYWWLASAFFGECFPSQDWFCFWTQVKIGSSPLQGVQQLSPDLGMIWLCSRLFACAGSRSWFRYEANFWQGLARLGSAWRDFGYNADCGRGALKFRDKLLVSKCVCS
jgi:hypothetical protein